MKKYAAIVCTVFLLALSAGAQESLLSQATNGLFTNANDWIMGPNGHFNTVKNDYLITSAAFNGSQSGGGAELGYFRAGSVPFGISLNLDMLSDKHLVKEEIFTGSTNTSIITEYSNPAFNSFGGTLRATIGFPQISNLSAGLAVHFLGNTNNAYKTVKTTSVNGNVINSVTAEYQTSSYAVTFSIPFGLTLGPVYNLTVPVFNIEGSSAKGQGSLPPEKFSFSFFIYDKAVFFSLIPGGTETAVWAGAGNAVADIAQLEIPAFGSDTGRSVSGQAGISNRFDFTPADAVTIILNPKFHIDWLLGNNGSYKVGYTIASDIGLYAKIPGLPIAVFFGMTPRLLFWHGSTVDERNTGTVQTTVTYAERKLGTDILWSGRLGLSMLLPRDMTFDITCNVNTSESLVNLSAQMTIHL